MYLRLKSYHSPHFQLPKEPRSATLLAPSIRDELRRRHLRAYDWVHGGPAGAIKFIDLDQLEYCVSRAKDGDFLATLMSNLYLDGLCKAVVPDLGGACQFSIGTKWNHSNQFFTLAGQAITLQAIALCGPLQRDPKLFEIGRAIHRFASSNCRSLGLLGGAGRSTPIVAATVSPRVRDNAWYAMALHQFAGIYCARSLQREAASIWFASMELYSSNLDGAGTDRSLRLDDKLAAATGLTHFGALWNDAKAVDDGISLAVECAAEYASGDCGYGQIARRHATDDQAIDMDCTIGIVRTCLNLMHLRPNADLFSIVTHGTAALFNPRNAFCREPETGVLLVADELEALNKSKMALAS